MLTRWDPIPDDLLAAIDEAVEKLLARFQIAAPPINALEIALRMGVNVSKTQRDRLRARRPSKPAKRVGSDGPAQPQGTEISARQQVPSGGRDLLPPRRSAPVCSIVAADPQDFESHRAAALALGRSLVEAVFDSVHVAPDEPMPHAATRVAGLFVPRLLLPTRWFRDDRRRLGGDLRRLQARYATASLESVAWRLLDLEEPVIVTIFDNNHVVSRRANVSSPGITPEPAGAELAAQSYCHAYSRPRIEHSPGLTARAWPLHRADWRREIVVALLDHESFEDPMPSGEHL